MGNLQEELIRIGLAKKEKSPPKKEKRPKNKLSQRDLEELMGVRKPRFSRHKGGAYRQK
ncbi:hypothetical protein [Indiicoccus explosivorum]|uniref:hypothetical protein n=1 Tax=Indiicoccus explosivorum TaxID=1917864 RepID=UPI0012D75060|nr:hypothetical protein [Indiicoccus explosivorum]